jgi:hypothetical protein
MDITDPISTEEAAQIAGLARSRVQQLCRAYLESGSGLTCYRIGEGKHSTLFVSRAAAEAYRDAGIKRGWPKGRPRGTKKSASSDDASAARMGSTRSRAISA